MALIPRDTDNAPLITVAAKGYVTGAGPAATTTGATDYAFTFASTVYHIMLQNNTSADLNFELEIEATAGSPVLKAGTTMFLDVVCSTIHLLTAANQNVNGISSGNIVIRGWT